MCFCKTWFITLSDRSNWKKNKFEIVFYDKTIWAFVLHVSCQPSSLWCACCEIIIMHQFPLSPWFSYQSSQSSIQILKRNVHKLKLGLEVYYWTWKKVVTAEPGYIGYVCVHVIVYLIKTNLCILNTVEVRKIMFCVFFSLSTCIICTLLFVIEHYVETKTVDQVNDWEFCQLYVGLQMTYCTGFKYPNLLKYIMYNTNPQRFT